MTSIAPQEEANVNELDGGIEIPEWIPEYIASGVIPGCSCTACDVKKDSLKKEYIKRIKKEKAEEKEKAEYERLKSKYGIKDLPVIYDFCLPREIKTILVIGCGGTGGHLIPDLARAVYVFNALRVKTRKINLILADGDSVEEKNIKRQNFILPDIGKNKAEVLAERYSAAFGIEITAIPSDIENFRKINGMTATVGLTTAVIGCVDNNASRKIIHSWFTIKDRKHKLWIDAGNEVEGGQVVCGFNHAKYSSTNPVSWNNVLNKVNMGHFSLPSVTEIYPEIMRDKSKLNSELSCAERAESAPQSMQANVTAATIIMNFMQRLLTGGTLKSHAVTFTIDNSFSNRLNVTDNLKSISKTRLNNWELTSDGYY